MNGLKIPCLKRVMKNNPLLSVTFLNPFKTSEYDWFSVFWWNKKATLGSNGLKSKGIDERLC